MYIFPIPFSKVVLQQYCHYQHISTALCLFNVMDKSQTARQLHMKELYTIWSDLGLIASWSNVGYMLEPISRKTYALNTYSKV